MNIIKYIFGLGFALLLLQSCQSNTNQIIEEPISAPTVTVAADRLPNLSRDEIIAMHGIVDDIDIQFLDKGFSINAPGPMAQNTIATFSDQGVDRVPCKEIAFLFIKSQGEQIAHVGAFFGEGCYYYVFYEDNKPKYANAMNQEGVAFFTRILAQVNTTSE